MSQQRPPCDGMDTALSPGEPIHYNYVTGFLSIKILENGIRHYKLHHQYTSFAAGV